MLVKVLPDKGHAVLMFRGSRFWENILGIKYLLLYSIWRTFEHTQHSALNNIYLSIFKTLAVSIQNYNGILITHATLTRCSPKVWIDSAAKICIRFEWAIAKQLIDRTEDNRRSMFWLNENKLYIRKLKIHSNIIQWSHST